MRDPERKWLVGGLTGCVSGCGCFVLTSLLTIGGAWALWELGHVRERWLKGDRVMVWGPLVGLLLGAFFGAVMAFVGARLAARRARKAAGD